VLKFVDIVTRKMRVRFIAKKIVIPNGVYNDIEELIFSINTEGKSTKSPHLYFEQQNATGGKIGIGLAVKMMEIAKRFII